MDDMSSIFYQFGAWNWLIFGGLMMVLELLAPGVFLMWFGIAAAIVGAIALNVDISWQVQFLLFGGIALVLLVFARMFVKSGTITSERPLLNRRAKQHVGKTYIVEQAIVNGRGKLRVGDSLWNAEGPDAPKGARMRVVSTDGSLLHVEKGEI